MGDMVRLARYMKESESKSGITTMGVFSVFKRFHLNNCNDGEQVEK